MARHIFTNDDDHLTADDWAATERLIRRRTRQQPNGNGRQGPAKARREARPPRTADDQAFKCGHCRQFIGAPISGGRHRNHCPNCLYSKHVDRKQPGDRKSDCRSLMAPAGVLSRRNGEQMILHRCLGCGKEAPNRIAADDNPLALLRIPPAAPLVALLPAPAIVDFGVDIEIAEDDEGAEIA